MIWLNKLDKFLAENIIHIGLISLIIVLLIVTSMVLYSLYSFF